MTTWRELCRELIDSRGPDYYRTLERARKALADGPAVPDGREPAAVVGEPSDEEIMELMPKEMHADLAAAARAMAEQTGTDSIRVKGLHRIMLNRHVVDLARAVLARWGSPNLAEIRKSLGEPVERQVAPVPVAVSERLPGPEDCDAEGRCWLLTVEDEYPQWRLHSVEGNQPGGETLIWVPVDSSPGVMVDCFYASHWLPAHALPIPSGEVEQ